MSGPHSTMDASFSTTSSAYHRRNRIISNHDDHRRPRGGGGGDEDDSSRPRRRRRLPHPALTALVIPCCLLLASSSSSSSPANYHGWGCHGLSTVVLPATKGTTTRTKTFPQTSSSSSPPSSSSSSSRTSVRRNGIVRVLRKDGIGLGRKSKQPASADHYRRRYDADADADALVAALFDDDFSSSLEIAIAGLGSRSSTSSSSSLAAGAATTTTDGKERAEENDRVAEEDAVLASEVRRNLGLVDEMRKGADVDVDFAEILRREAADRRGGMEARRPPMGEGSASVVVVDANAPAGPHVEVVRRSKRPSPARGVIRRRTAKKSSGGDDDDDDDGGGSRRSLLTREREYALARTIRSGARLHNLRAEYESTSSSGVPISKREWAKLAGLTPNDLRKLISDYRTAKEELVSRNVGLVRAVVRSQYARRAEHRGVPIEELIQEGSLGLIRAAELFDPSRGLRFSTYATIWIKGVLSNSNSLDEVISLPSREKAIHNKVRRAWEEMAIETGDGDGAARGGGKRPSASSAEELAVRLGMDKSSVEEHLRRMACVTNVLSLDYRYSSSTRSGHSSGDMDEALRSCSSFGTDADLAERAQFRADVVSGLVKNLTERELTLMRLRYGLEDGTEHTVKECAARMGINKETARLLQHACLKKLREASNMESLQEYLLTVA